MVGRGPKFLRSIMVHVLTDPTTHGHTWFHHAFCTTLPNILTTSEKRVPNQEPRGTSWSTPIGFRFFTTKNLDRLNFFKYHTCCCAHLTWVYKLYFTRYHCITVHGRLGWVRHLWQVDLVLDGKIFCTGQSSKAVFETPEYLGCNAYNRDGWWVWMFCWYIHNFKDGLSLSCEESKFFTMERWLFHLNIHLKALLVSPLRFRGQVRCFNGREKFPTKTMMGTKKPNENSQQNSQWKFPNEVEPFPANCFFWGNTTMFFGDSFEMRCSLDPRNWAVEMRRHLRRGKFKAQQFIFAIKAATLGREGTAPKKKAFQLGKYGGKGDCVLGVSVSNLGSWLLLRNCQFFLIRLGRDRNQLKPQITSRSKLLLPAHQA